MMHAPAIRPLNTRSNVLAALEPSRGDVGPASIGALVVGYAALWVALRSSSEPWGTYIGQLLGAESILLLSVALVLISTLPWVETWFHGIDRAAIWHRRIAIAGVVLLVPHIVLASNPDGTSIGGTLAPIGAIGLFALAIWSVLPRWRAIVPSALLAPIDSLRKTVIGELINWLFGNYERWRAVHRLTGLFVAAGFVHGLLDATPFDGSPALRWSFIAIGGIGLTFYLYRELLARYFWPFHDYQVERVQTMGKGIFEVTLTPLGQPLIFQPGQFVLLYIETKDGWERHPFTIASAPQERFVRFTIKELGDYTSRMQDSLRPGMPAVLGEPHGHFDWRTGTGHQIWIAAGVGVTPFLSWLRSLTEPIEREIDFYYTSDGPAPFADEILDIAARQPTLRAHLVDTRSQGRLTPGAVLEATSAPPRDLSLFICGPEGMIERFKRDFRRAGVPRSQIHHEYFNVR